MAKGTARGANITPIEQIMSKVSALGLDGEGAIKGTARVLELAQLEKRIGGGVGRWLGVSFTFGTPKRWPLAALEGWPLVRGK